MKGMPMCGGLLKCFKVEVVFAWLDNICSQYLGVMREPRGSGQDC